MTMDQLVAERLAIIKAHMPEVYDCIQERAQHAGPEVFALVRKGLRGEPGCFYAMEAGHVVGTPFGREHPLMREAAEFVVVFGRAHVCVWPDRIWAGGAALAAADAGGADGAH